MFYGRQLTAGDIYTVAGDGGSAFGGDGGPAANAGLDAPFGTAVDAAGNLVITDMGHHRVRVVAARTGTFYGQPMTAADIYTVAGNGIGGFAGDGGPATSAELGAPEGIAIDDAGDLIFTDFGAARVRVVAARTGTLYGIAMTAGDIYTIAGNGAFGFTGDGGPAASASLNEPAGIAVSSTGEVVVADMSNNRIRVISP